MRTDRKRSRRANPIAVVLAVLFFSVSVVCFLLCIPKTGLSETVLSAFERTSRTKQLDPDADFVRFNDVGQGESILFCSNGQTALLDVGPAEAEHRLNEDLNTLGIRELSAVMLSHGHLDHVGGLTGLMKEHPVRVLIHPFPGDAAEGSSVIHAAQVAVAGQRGENDVFCDGVKITVGEFRITALMYRRDAKDENDRSVILLAQKDDLRFLMMGDAGTETERLLLEKIPDLRCDVLKVGHHGSSKSTGSDLLRVCQPRYAVISCGEGNEYSHPHGVVLSRLEQAHVSVLRTDRNGSVTFDVTDGKLKCEPERGDPK